jgi:shikimate dehydrogenase
VWALLDAGAGEVRVWNRTPQRARELCAEIGGSVVEAAEPADLLINCTPSGMDASAEPFEQLPLDPDRVTAYGCVVDYVYGNSETPLVQAARAHAIPVIDGLELLVGQGAISFEQFTGRAAPVDVMRAAARGAGYRPGS